MRMSCNGCRVLRKGCSDNCSIRPCLQWIKNPESQANATVFLAKFYGRAGLMNLINAGPDHLRPAIFRSLLYEACGRIVNPIYGSVGLLWSGSWQLCQAAVEAVLKGAPITQIPTEAAANTPTPPLRAYDIRHVSKQGGHDSSPGTGELHKLNKSSRTRFKRSLAAGAAATADDSNSRGTKSTSPDSAHASLHLGAAAEDPEEEEYDHAVDRVADDGGDFDGFGLESSDSHNEYADDRCFHELRLMDTAAAAAATVTPLRRTTDGDHLGSRGSVSASEDHHHDSTDASMVTSHNHGGVTSEEDEDHDRASHQEGGDDGDEVELELELTLGGPNRRRS